MKIKSYSNRKDFIFTDEVRLETFRNFTILNKALLFLIKLNQTAVQAVPKSSNILSVSYHA